MRNQVHMTASEDRIEWGEGKDVVTLCEWVILKAMPVFDFDIREGHLESARTLHLCKACLIRGLSPVTGVRYLYGVLEREAALRLNRESEEN